jgi:phosphatidylserine/phosphatidylglycerophosphate/cardiolipin synthase-like enzyme
MSTFRLFIFTLVLAQAYLLSSCTVEKSGKPVPLFDRSRLTKIAVEGKQEIIPVVNREYLPTVLELIRGAEKNIDFIQLEFHYDPAVKKVQDALREAVSRGVRVRGIIDNRIGFNVTSIGYLQKYGIEAKLDTPHKMTHNKLFIVDTRETLVGSTNLSQNSMERNNETNVLIRDPAIGSFFERYFEALWSNSEREPGIGPFSSGKVEVIFNRSYFEEVLRLFQKARDSIRVILYGMSYSYGNPDAKASRLVDALIAASKRGVNVKVLLDKSDYNQIINKVNERSKRHLEEGGVEVRYDDEHVTSHAKLILVDGSVVIGSVNWGRDALEERNESSVLIRDPSVSKFFMRYFDTLWRGEPWPQEYEPSRWSLRFDFFPRPKVAASAGEDARLDNGPLVCQEG